ncbi:hypothetical protein [Neomoorella glycerini]|nr:hypothetical protein [Moorella glycerini]
MQFKRPGIRPRGAGEGVAVCRRRLREEAKRKIIRQVNDKSCS